MPSTSTSVVPTTKPGDKASSPRGEPLTVTYTFEEAPEEDEGVLATDGLGTRSVYRYKMRSKPHGFCLIVNNKTFKSDDPKKKLSERKGTEEDVDRLRETFEKLGYKVRVKHDRTSEGLKELFKEFTIDYIRESDDSFVCCILSHGKEGEVFGTDTVGVPIRELSQSLSECENLWKKPKMFFIQACQGPDQPAQLEPDTPKEAEEKGVALPRDSDFFLG